MTKSTLSIEMTIDLLWIIFAFSTIIIYMTVLNTARGRLCGVWNRESTPCPLYISSPFGKALVLNDDGSGNSVVVVGDLTLIARFMGSTWGPHGGDRTQVGPCWPHELYCLGSFCYIKKSLYRVYRKWNNNVSKWLNELNIIQVMKICYNYGHWYICITSQYVYFVLI